ncbi:sulfurtransferase [Acrocarpospora macrocephala]|uniref:Sulfurtransferase n=1 Tax=Acrocarpospora macrocephala TaxID=150177 RepID=A0A5M3WGB0_9ACTN|nr:rhodanese-like domain-containing protein [Acrocarpospora macrocephala]GES07320.1 sulfurtransferase [Acrocarpospora macrocephala]
MTGPLVDPAWLAERDGLVVLDATVVLPAPRHDGDHRSSSGRDGWAREHIPGSVHADLLHDLSDPGSPWHFARPAPDVLAERLGGLGVADGTTVVAYDTAGGLWAARLWWLLRWIGVDAHVLDGGLRAWRDAGLPTAAGLATTTPGSLTPRPRNGYWVGKDDLVSWSEGAVAATVVCALSPETFRGEVPSRYARRGHIPGSANVPARGLTGPDGRYLPAGELRAATADLGEGPVWIYCGGGISAASLALVLTLLGRDEVAIYDGSLEEWAADPALPLAVGAPR